MHQHLEAAKSNRFAGRYLYLVYWARYDPISSAIKGKKEIKGDSRAKKEALIASINPGWLFLKIGWLYKWQGLGQGGAVSQLTTGRFFAYALNDILFSERHPIFIFLIFIATFKHGLCVTSAHNGIELKFLFFERIDLEV